MSAILKKFTGDLDKDLLLQEADVSAIYSRLSETKTRAQLISIQGENEKALNKLGLAISVLSRRTDQKSIDEFNKKKSELYSLEIEKLALPLAITDLDNADTPKQEAKASSIVTEMGGDSFLVDELVIEQTDLLRHAKTKIAALQERIRDEPLTPELKAEFLAAHKDLILRDKLLGRYLKAANLIDSFSEAPSFSPPVLRSIPARMPSPPRMVSPSKMAQQEQEQVPDVVQEVERAGEAKAEEEKALGVEVMHECVIDETLVPQSELLKCGHAVCKEDLPKLQKRECPYCRQFLAGPTVTPDVVAKIMYNMESADVENETKEYIRQQLIGVYNVDDSELYDKTLAELETLLEEKYRQSVNSGQQFAPSVSQFQRRFSPQVAPGFADGDEGGDVTEDLMNILAMAFAQRNGQSPSQYFVRSSISPPRRASPSPSPPPSPPRRASPPRRGGGRGQRGRGGRFSPRTNRLLKEREDLELLEALRLSTLEEKYEEPTDFEDMELQRALAMGYSSPVIDRQSTRSPLSPIGYPMAASTAPNLASSIIATLPQRRTPNRGEFSGSPARRNLSGDEEKFSPPRTRSPVSLSRPPMPVPRSNVVTISDLPAVPTSTGSNRSTIPGLAPIFASNVNNRSNLPAVPGLAPIFTSNVAPAIPSLGSNIQNQPLTIPGLAPIFTSNVAPAIPSLNSNVAPTIPPTPTRTARPPVRVVPGRQAPLLLTMPPLPTLAPLPPLPPLGQAPQLLSRPSFSTQPNLSFQQPSQYQPFQLQPPPLLQPSQYQPLQMAPPLLQPPSFQPLGALSMRVPSLSYQPLQPPPLQPPPLQPLQPPPLQFQQFQQSLGGLSLRAPPLLQRPPQFNPNGNGNL